MAYYYADEKMAPKWAHKFLYSKTIMDLWPQVGYKVYKLSRFMIFVAQMGYKIFKSLVLRRYIEWISTSTNIS